ncbi:hypothetical protein A0130_02530 [Leifsonia xyli]|uniref:hypothetical protein n=1 Tax=Leifsonia xyli TaxID=1575 RepID=UPI0007CDA4BA|nr:hypothetical protein A0130_02530 [Leifsonia xyli]
MTDPRTRRPEFWRNIGFVYASAAGLCLLGGILVLFAGITTGWFGIGLGFLSSILAIVYFRHYRRGKRGRDFGPRT